ncbi:hypothetical protein REPUB_Repub13aG0013600 [Reevesia pubescens]
MSDWRKSRAMRILAIDRGHVSFADIDFKSGSKKTIILPMFPLDSRFMSSSSLHREYGNPDIVMEAPMTKHGDRSSRGDLYMVPWNYKAFEDTSADRFWLQIEATDIMGQKTMTELRSLSVNGLHAKVSWTWKEFFVMGCQWAALYYPILWLALYFPLLVLLIPRAFLFFSRKQYTYKNLLTAKGLINHIGLVLQELCMVPIACEDRGYMTYMGWVVKSSNNKRNHDYIGSPDVMAVVLPHLIFVVLPAILLTGALVAKRAVHRDKFLPVSGKKENDYSRLDKRSLRYDFRGSRRSKFRFGGHWIRLIPLLLCLALCWKHFKNCRALMKAYEMNPFLHFPVYTLGIPLLLVYVIHKTNRD